MGALPGGLTRVLAHVLHNVTATMEGGLGVERGAHRAVYRLGAELLC